MENATKALLIAAAVLIAIILVASGVLLIRNIGDTDDQAKEVGNLIDEATGNASHVAIGASKGVIISKSKFNSFIDNFHEKYSNFDQFIDVIEKDQNVKLSNQIQIIGYIYQDNGNKIDSEVTAKMQELEEKTDSSNQENNKEYFDYVINVWIPRLLEEGKLKSLVNPLDKDEIITKHKEVYKNKMGKELTDQQIKNKRIWYGFFFGYDEWGYINKAIYVSGMDF